MEERSWEWFSVAQKLIAVSSFYSRPSAPLSELSEPISSAQKAVNGFVAGEREVTYRVLLLRFPLYLLFTRSLLERSSDSVVRAKST